MKKVNIYRIMSKKTEMVMHCILLHSRTNRLLGLVASQFLALTNQGNLPA